MNCMMHRDENNTLRSKLLETIAELDTALLELETVKTHLKKYTAPERQRTYYQTHKDELKSDPEYKKRRSEINKRAYQKRKQTVESSSSDISSDNNAQV